MIAAPIFQSRIYRVAHRGHTIIVIAKTAAEAISIAADCLVCQEVPPCAA